MLWVSWLLSKQFWYVIKSHLLKKMPYKPLTNFHFFSCWLFMALLSNMHIQTFCCIITQHYSVTLPGWLFQASSPIPGPTWTGVLSKSSSAAYNSLMRRWMHVQSHTEWSRPMPWLIKVASSSCFLCRIVV